MKIRAVILGSDERRFKHIKKILKANEQFELLGGCRTLMEVEEMLPDRTPELLVLKGGPTFPTQLQLREGSRTHFIKVQDIDYVEADHNYVIVHIAAGKRRGRATLSAIGSKLPSHQFFRVNHSLIVNLNRVLEVRRAKNSDLRLVLNTGKEVPITRKIRAREIRQRLEFCSA